MNRRPQTFSIRGRAPSGVAGAESLDVTPIMNMFVILIPFLVSMAVFSQLAVLRFELPGENQDLRADPLLPITVALTRERLAITHGERLVAAWERTPQGRDFASLAVIRVPRHMTHLSVGSRGVSQFDLPMRTHRADPRRL